MSGASSGSEETRLKQKLVDVTERTLATFGQSFLAAAVVGSVTDLDSLKIAAAAGGLAVAKYLLLLANSYLGNPPS